METNRKHIFELGVPPSRFKGFLVHVPALMQPAFADQYNMEELHVPGQHMSFKKPYKYHFECLKPQCR